MARAQRNGRRAALERPPRKGGGLLLGLLIGLVAGLVVAAGIAWYLNMRPGPYKPIEPAPPAPAPAAAPAATPATSHPAADTGASIPSPARADRPASPGAAVATPKPTNNTEDAPARRPETPRATTANPAVAKTPTPTAAKPPAPSPAKPPSASSDFTFFDILPGEQPAKPAPKSLQLPREVWWLQVAALKEAKDAERLKARLAQLGLPVQLQPVASGETTLHRVRVGPFKTEDEALAALDTLAENQYEPRLLKEKLDKP
ncbi:MAG: SPOR domain-containing protein [Thiobacillaceae bacterium]|nr:SPOR domain-containing protein [Thiobacillaceae bacterium]